MPTPHTRQSPLEQLQTTTPPACCGPADNHKTQPIAESLHLTHGMLRDRLGVDEYKAHRIIRGMIERGEIDAGRMVGKYRWYRVISKQ